MIHDDHVMQQFADGNVMVIGHGSQKVKLSDSQEIEKNNWAIQSLKEMVLSPVMMVARNFGIVTVVNDTSNIEKLLRKKYMGA